MPSSRLRAATRAGPPACTETRAGRREALDSGPIDGRKGGAVNGLVVGVPRDAGRTEREYDLRQQRSQRSVPYARRGDTIDNRLPHATTAARIRIDLERTLGAVDRRIFGAFIEHLGRCIYG